MQTRRRRRLTPLRFCAAFLTELALLGIGMSMAECALADPSPADESLLKSAFVYNFIKLTDWPAEVWSKTDRIKVCLAGPNNELAKAVTELAHKPPVDGKSLEVRPVTMPSEVAACQVLVVTFRDHVGTEWIRAVKGAPVLTIGDSDGFAAAGGLIGFYRDAINVRFEASLETARRSNLKPSSQLLKLARLVADAPGAKP